MVFVVDGDKNEFGDILGFDFFILTEVGLLKVAGDGDGEGDGDNNSEIGLLSNSCNTNAASLFTVHYLRYLYVIHVCMHIICIYK